jgi:hypothetical protein
LVKEIDMSNVDNVDKEEYDLFNLLHSSYLFMSDPSHAWLKVKLAELKELGIDRQISSYSYVDRNREWVYLEEDCDAEVFIRAKDNRGELPKLLEQHTDSESPIRYLDRYVA